MEPKDLLPKRVVSYIHDMGVRSLDHLANNMETGEPAAVRVAWDAVRMGLGVPEAEGCPQPAASRGKAYRNACRRTRTSIMSGMAGGRLPRATHGL